jgi:hypothetical protein
MFVHSNFLPIFEISYHILLISHHILIIVNMVQLVFIEETSKHTQEFKFMGEAVYLGGWRRYSGDIYELRIGAILLGELLVLLSDGTFGLMTW